MTTAEAATPEEIIAVQEDLEFPADLDWRAEYTVRQHPTGNRLKLTSEDWLYAIEHQYSGIEQLLTDEAERYIHDTIEPGIHVACSTEIALRDGRVTALMTMHPAVLDHKGNAHAIGSGTIAKAEVGVSFRSDRTGQLVRSAVNANHAPEEPLLLEENCLTQDHELPDGLDWTINYTSLVSPEDSIANDTDWAKALCDSGNPAGALTGRHTSASELGGQTCIFRFEFGLNGRNLPVAHATLHPADMNSLEPEPNLDQVIAQADIVMEPSNPRTTAAIVQYIRENHL